MKIAHIVGARPNFIKLKTVLEALREYNVAQVIIHTGQHYDYELSKLFFKELDIPQPDYNLAVGSGMHGLQTGRMLEKAEKVLMKEKPDATIVYGDTNSTLSGALASVKLGIPVAHVEAGVRCYSRYMPEEVNRIVVDHISEFLFAPTRTAVGNLRAEGLYSRSFLTGDVMLDLFLKYKALVESVGTEDFLLVTIHRAENTDNPIRLKTILNALVESKEQIIFPMHPRTRNNILKFNFQWFLSNEKIKVVPPVGYIDFLKFIKKSKKVVTDSGGVQKEAFFIGRPCITLRNVTEWPETVEAGWNVLVDANKEKILEAIKEFKPAGRREIKLFGDGMASNRIANIITKSLDVN